MSPLIRTLWKGTTEKTYSKLEMFCIMEQAVATWLYMHVKNSNSSLKINAHYALYAHYLSKWQKSFQ